MALIRRNGNNKIPPTILKITSNVNPNILNGNRMIQAMMKRKNKPMANGQHITKSMHKSIKAIKVFIDKNFLTKLKNQALNTSF